MMIVILTLYHSQINVMLFFSNLCQFGDNLINLENNTNIETAGRNYIAFIL